MKIAEAVRALLNFRITLFFYLAYLSVNYVYVVVLPGDILNYGAVFLTSPFNILETLSPLYFSFGQGLVENFALVVLFMGLTESYSRFSMVRVKAYLSVDAAFVLSIASTYATSALWWWKTGAPASGTSVVALCMLLYLATASVCDFDTYASRRQMHGAEFAKVFLWVLATPISLVAASTYVLGNPHSEIHIAGAVVFTALAGMVLWGEAHRNHDVVQARPRPEAWK
ncbi:MAG: hypothetical protein JRN18_02030 [Nitrososphaerota archaeon]|jgi:hypothetical protein|nr:hypothetical protein [Nitrososphaerota archaeon]MDG6916873.1 hypothetical protein [Nitrososphaerota archaeon]